MAFKEGSPELYASAACQAANAPTVCSKEALAHILRQVSNPIFGNLVGLAAAIAPKVETLVVTRSEDGALATRGGERADVPAEAIKQLVDTTGAGDLFAAGFLLGTARGKDLEASLRLGAICAAEVIQHYGARPEADLKARAGDLLA
jgi:sugar/nucleoside kinase (ribokinase family)